MIPSLYKMAGELLPGVFHVSARSIATMLYQYMEIIKMLWRRQTGVTMLLQAMPKKLWILDLFPT